MWGLNLKDSNIEELSCGTDTLVPGYCVYMRNNATKDYPRYVRQRSTRSVHVIT